VPKYFFFFLMQKQKKNQTSSPYFVLVPKFCTSSEKIVPKVKFELQHIHVSKVFGE